VLGRPNSVLRDSVSLLGPPHSVSERANSLLQPSSSVLRGSVSLLGHVSSLLRRPLGLTTPGAPPILEQKPRFSRRLRFFTGETGIFGGRQPSINAKEGQDHEPLDQPNRHARLHRHRRDLRGAQPLRQFAQVSRHASEHTLLGDAVSLPIFPNPTGGDYLLVYVQTAAVTMDPHWRFSFTPGEDACI